MTGKQNTPEIRFEGFTDPWEQRKFSDMYVVNNERNANCELGYDRTLSIATMTFNGGNGAADDSLSNYKVIRVGDIAFEGHTNKAHAYGRFVLNDTGDGLMSPRFSCLRPIVEQRYSFWKYYIPREESMRPILVNATKSGTMMNELVSDDLMRESILVPCLAEQEVIGNSLSQLDHLITLHQRKYDKLCTVKKSMLDKMFPKPGETEPEIRFEGFTDPWEQRKLGELIQLGGSGGTPSANNPDYYGGDIPFLSIADINGRDITNTAKTLTDEGLQNSAAWIVPSGAVSLAMYASVGKVGIIRQDTATSQAFYNMVFDNEALRDFVFTRLEKAETDSEWEPYISTGTQRNLNADKVKSFSLDVPSNEEASEISAYFANLDTLITLHQRKLELLRNIKKSLLDRMFV